MVTLRLISNCIHLMSVIILITFINLWEITVFMFRCFYLSELFEHSLPEDFINIFSVCSKRRKTEKGGKGLRHFSMKVCEKVRKKGTTSYNEVADELVAEFTNPDLPANSCEQVGSIYMDKSCIFVSVVTNFMFWNFNFLFLICRFLKTCHLDCVIRNTKCFPYYSVAL